MSIRLAAMLFLAAPVAAETVATPATFSTLFAAAAAGDTIRLAPGSYPSLRLRDRHWATPVSIDASAAQLRSVRFDLVSGVTWHGGSFDGGDVEREGFRVSYSDHIAIDGATFRHFISAGVILGGVSDARVVNTLITDSGSDGIDIAWSRRVLLDHNRCNDFHPGPGAHPDCIQLWSIPAQPPTADITLTNNEAIGDMAGFNAFNGVHNGIDDGGFDRITIEHNVAKVTLWHGIALMACRHCSVRHNRADSIPSATYPNARAWIRVFGGTDVVDCDNLAVSYPRDANRAACRDGS